MWKTLDIAWNRLLNTAAIAPRTAGTIITTAADLFTTLKTIWKESVEIIADTSQKTKKVLINTWTEKTNIFKKALKIAVSPVVAGATIAEWGLRSIAQPAINWISNTRNTWKNTIKNARRSTLGRVLSKKPISDFSYDNLSTRNLNLNWSVAWWRLGWWWKTESKWSEQSVEEKKKSSRWPKSKGVSRWPKSKKEITKTDENTKEKTLENKSEETKTKIIDMPQVSDKKEDAKEVKEEKEDANIQKTNKILANSQQGEWLYKSLQTKYPWLKMIYKKDSSHGEIKKWTNKWDVDIIIWEKIPKDKYQIAPLNDKKDPEYQKKHLIAHEFSHLIMGENSEDKHLHGLLDMSKKYYAKNKQTLTPLAQMKMYKSDDDKAKEDLAEILAMSSLNANLFNKYLTRLTSDKKEDVAYRKEFNLAKITETEKDSIKAVCQSTIWKYTKNENKTKTINLESEKLKEENRDSNKAKQDHLANAA